MSGTLTVEPAELAAVPISTDGDDCTPSAVRMAYLPKGIMPLPARKVSASARQKQTGICEG